MSDTLWGIWLYHNYYLVIIGSSWVTFSVTVNQGMHIRSASVSG